MKFHACPLSGVFRVEPDVHRDERGAFTSLFEAGSFSGRSGAPWTQVATSWNPVRGTLRGLHYQAQPSEEAKLVHCLRGAVFDVVLDLRRESPTFLQWHAVDLRGEEEACLLIPKGCAHGFQSLVEATLLLYCLSAPYAKESAAGVRWDDPWLAIPWPLPLGPISPRDAKLPYLSELFPSEPTGPRRV